MPKYDYEIRSGRADEVSGTVVTRKGTVEAPDRVPAALIAFVHSRLDAGDELPVWTGSIEEYLKAVGWDRDFELADSASKLDVDYERSPDEAFERYGEDFQLLTAGGDWVHEVSIYPHDPERFRRPQEVAVQVLLTVRQTGPETLPWEELQRLVLGRLQDLAGAVSTEFADGVHLEFKDAEYL